MQSTGRSAARAPRAYSIDQVLDMLPYVRSYCRSFLELAHDRPTADMSIEDMEFVLNGKMDREVRWREELSNLGFGVCSISDGLIDVPILHPHSGKFLMACVGIDTTSEVELMAHLPDQSSDKARRIWRL